MTMLYRAARWALLSTYLLLLGCDQGGSNNQTPAPDERSTVNAQSAPPLGQLGFSVEPTHYRLDLTIDPGQPDFHGSVEIDIKLNEPQDKIYLHGRDLAVTKVFLKTGDNTIEGQYRQVDETGVAEIRLQETAAAGPATLHFDYSAPFNDALEGLYRVTESDDDYAFTQFEATSARLAFPSFGEPAFKTPFDIAVTAQAEHEVITLSLIHI